MNELKTLAELDDNLNRYKEIIILAGKGRDANSVLDYLQFSGRLGKILCLTRTNLPYDTGHFFSHDLPIIPLKNLPHFRDTALFITVISSRYQQEMYNQLSEFGCKNILILGKNAFNQIQEALKEFLTFEQKFERFMNNVTGRLNLLEDQIEWHSDIVETNKKAFADYRNAFRGKEVVIVGSGPTIKYYKPIPGAIHIALNHAWQKENVDFDYLFTGDKFAMDKGKIPFEKSFDKIKDKIFVCKRIGNMELRWLDFGENISAIDKVRRFYISMNAQRKSICPDICFHSLFTMNSISESALMFALFTYPEKIYLAGCDTYPNGHFYKEPTAGENLEEEKKKQSYFHGALKVRYARIKTFADQYYPDTKIISINPIGLKDLFEDIYTDEYKASLTQNV